MEEARSPVYRALLVGSIPALFALVFLAGAPQLGVLAGGWALLLAFSSWRAASRLAPLAVRRTAPSSAHEDDEVVATVELERTRPGHAELVEVTDYFGAALASGQTVHQRDRLPAGIVQELSYAVQCSRTWGVYQVGPLVVSTSDPLGLFQAARTDADLREIAVFPRLHAVRELTARGARSTFSPAPVSAGRSGQGELVLGVREYRAGDEPRRVHWRATARRGRLMVREQEVDLLPYLTVFLDLAAESRAGLGRRSTLEVLVRIASSLIGSGAREGWHVQLLGEGAEPLAVPPGRGAAHLAFALDALIRVRMGGQVPLTEIVLRQLGSVPAGSTVVVLSGTATPDAVALRSALEGLRNRGADVAVVLVDDRSFRAIRRTEESPIELAAQRADVLEVLGDQGVLRALLSAEDSVEDRLARGLFTR